MLTSDPSDAQGSLAKYEPITAGDYIKSAIVPQFEAKKAWLAAQIPDGAGGFGNATSVNVVTCQATSLAA